MLARDDDTSTSIEHKKVAQDETRGNDREKRTGNKLVNFLNNSTIVKENYFLRESPRHSHFALTHYSIRYV